MRIIRVACVVLAIACGLSMAARANEWNKQTYLTFSAPVELPGITLPAGTYTFRLADSASDRHIVQVFDKDGKRLFATILAISDQRLEPTDKPVVMFGETAPGAPSAVRAWFYPGDTIGNEFVYPKKQAAQIAAAAHQPVLSMAENTSSRSDADRIRAMKNAKVSHVAPQAAAAAPAPQPPPAQSQRAPTSTTGSGSASAAATTGSPSARPARTLPSTASPLPIVELASVLALAGALGIRRLARALA